MPAKKPTGRTFFTASGIRSVRVKKVTQSALSAKKSPSATLTKRKKNPGFEKGLVFIGMSFSGDEGGHVFTAIKAACTQLKLKARRVDENFTSGFIILEIIHLIELAEFIIFDLTYERPNVYYELGYAHGVGNDPSNILLIAKAGTEIHFDIQGLRVQRYKSTRDLRKIVKAALTAAINQSRR